MERYTVQFEVDAPDRDIIELWANTVRNPATDVYVVSYGIDEG